ncbi:hypothetical protein TNCT_323801 [Trichonephila clavata]|uniref:Uncharacterized protein n=1 Tax=Trichonephila clavata TaxID=2740835 RepID=A0A8X6GQB2_TRICU|nr:hypothetical protein TNCT_323801 [Trichonephila clavata]
MRTIDVMLIHRIPPIATLRLTLAMNENKHGCISLPSFIAKVDRSVAAGGGQHGLPCLPTKTFHSVLSLVAAVLISHVGNTQCRFPHHL